MNLYDIFNDLRMELEANTNGLDAAIHTVAKELQFMVNMKKEELCKECEYKKLAKPAPVYIIGNLDPVDQDEEIETFSAPSGADCDPIAIVKGITYRLGEISGIRHRYFTREMLLAMGVEESSPLWDNPVAVVIRRTIFGNRKIYPDRLVLINQWRNEMGQAGYTKYIDMKLFSQESGISMDEIVMQEYLFYLAKHVIVNDGLAPEYQRFTGIEKGE